jgi:hypothetical protein
MTFADALMFEKAYFILIRVMSNLAQFFSYLYLRLTPLYLHSPRNVVTAVCEIVLGSYVSSHRAISLFSENLYTCFMQPSGSLYFQGASTALSPVDAMAGRVDSFDGGQAGNFHHFLPTHSRGRPTELATSESTGNSSQYSIPSNNLAFENYKVLFFLTHIF